MRLGLRESPRSPKVLLKSDCSLRVPLPEPWVRTTGAGGHAGDREADAAHAQAGVLARGGNERGRLLSAANQLSNTLRPQPLLWGLPRGPAGSPLRPNAPRPARPSRAGTPAGAAPRACPRVPALPDARPSRKDSALRSFALAPVALAVSVLAAAAPARAQGGDPRRPSWARRGRRGRRDGHAGPRRRLGRRRHDLDRVPGTAEFRSRPGAAPAAQEPARWCPQSRSCSPSSTGERQPRLGPQPRPPAATRRRVARCAGRPREHWQPYVGGGIAVHF